MPDKYQNKLRIPSARLPSWNYNNNAAYFITICTKNHRHYFGEIVNGEMRLSVLGEIVRREWLKCPILRPDMKLQLDEFVVMPNHFHAIIWIGCNAFNKSVETQCLASPAGKSIIVEPQCIASPAGKSIIVETQCIASLQEQQPKSINQFAPQSKNLSSIVRGFKSAVTTYARKNNLDFGWQSRFYDHIIRDDASYGQITNYIIDNPKNWG